MRTPTRRVTDARGDLPPAPMLHGANDRYDSYQKQNGVPPGSVHFNSNRKSAGAVPLTTSRGLVESIPPCLPMPSRVRRFGCKVLHW
jgi:hypothetical protein